MVNSRLSLFSATLSRSKCALFTIPEHPFSLSYGVILPSSLTRVLLRVLGFSPYLPVSVYGTGTFHLVSNFSRQLGISPFATSFRSPSCLSIASAFFTTKTTYSLRRTKPTVRGAYPSVSLLHSIDLRWYWNLHQLSITYALRPRLRSRLTLSGRAFLRNP